MLNYYRILKIEQNATNEEIKKAFRSLAKKYHPDKNFGKQKWAEEKIKLVIKAYKTLIDKNLRKNYDTIFQCNTNNTTTNNSSTEKPKQSIYHQIKSILHDLVNDNSIRAIKEFESLNRNVSCFDLHNYLTGRDYLDCVFLLAEEYEKTQKYDIALKFYKNIYQLEKAKKNDITHNFFFDESKNRIKTIYCKKLTKSASTRQSIEHYKNVLKLQITNNERAQIYKKISECYFILKDYQCAAANLNAALNIRPTLKGISRIQTKLNQHFAGV